MSSVELVLLLIGGDTAVEERCDLVEQEDDGAAGQRFDELRSQAAHLVDVRPRVGRATTLIARLGLCCSSPGRPIVREEAKDGFVRVGAVHPGRTSQRSLPREPDPGCRREHRAVVREGLDLQAL